MLPFNIRNTLPISRQIINTKSFVCMYEAHASCGMKFPVQEADEIIEVFVVFVIMCSLLVFM